MGALLDRVRTRKQARREASLLGLGVHSIFGRRALRCTSCDRRALGSLDALSNMECRRQRRCVLPAVSYHIRPNLHV